MSEVLKDQISTDHGEKVEVLYPNKLELPKWPDFDATIGLPDLVMGFFRELWEANGLSVARNNHFKVLALPQPGEQPPLLLANRYSGLSDREWEVRIANLQDGNKQPDLNGTRGVETYSLTTPDLYSKAPWRARITASASLLVSHVYHLENERKLYGVSSGSPNAPSYPAMGADVTTLHVDKIGFDATNESADYLGQWQFKVNEQLIKLF